MQFTFDKLGATNRTCCHEMTIDTSYKYFFFVVVWEVQMYRNISTTPNVSKNNVGQKCLSSASCIPYCIFNFFWLGGLSYFFPFCLTKRQKNLFTETFKTQVLFSSFVKTNVMVSLLFDNVQWWLPVPVLGNWRLYAPIIIWNEQYSSFIFRKLSLCDKIATDAVVQ